MLFLFSITWGAISGWWALACLLLGCLYAWLMYRQPVELGKQLRYILFACRALSVFIISLLILAPLVKSVNYQSQKPLVLVLQDNSESIKLFPAPNSNPADLITGLYKLKFSLGDNYDVQEFNFDRTLHNGLSNTFNGKQTDIANALKQLNERYVNQNIGAVILATDGLYNQGTDPRYEARNIKSTIYTIALGDTTAKRDLLIANVNYNKTAFLGNDFEIEVLAEAYQSKGENMRLTITEDGKQVSTQNIAVNTDAFQKLVPIKLNADKKGIRKFTISIAPVKNELSTQNNTETIYVDILDDRQKILLVYNNLHPDINVLKQDIESDKNYEVKTVVLSDLNSIKPGDYSLIILHQLTGEDSPILQNIITKTKTPVWYMIGGQTNLQGFNAAQHEVKVYDNSDQLQEVFALPQPEFSAFTLSDSAKQKISSFPPLLAPFGNYSSSPGNQVLFKQKIGEIATSYPLLSFADEGGRRIGLLLGEGLWRWQLAEYKANENHHAMEELMDQSVQYLTANANHEQFRVYPAKNVFDEGEDVIINAELYNDALELVNTSDVHIDLTAHSGKKYSFLFSRNGQSYQLNAGTLPVDEYSYTASTKVGTKTFIANGKLTVKALNLQTRQSAANHQLVNTIARQSGGQMLLPSQMDKLADLIRKNDNIKTIVYEAKHYDDLVNVKWVFLLILALLSGEWFMRKREGLI